MPDLSRCPCELCTSINPSTNPECEMCGNEPSLPKGSFKDVLDQQLKAKQPQVEKKASGGDSKAKPPQVEKEVSGGDGHGSQWVTAAFKDVLDQQLKAKQPQVEKKASGGDSKAKPPQVEKKASGGDGHGSQWVTAAFKDVIDQQLKAKPPQVEKEASGGDGHGSKWVTAAFKDVLDQQLKAKPPQVEKKASGGDGKAKPPQVEKKADGKQVKLVDEWETVLFASPDFLVGSPVPASETPPPGGGMNRSRDGNRVARNLDFGGTVSGSRGAPQPTFAANDYRKPKDYIPQMINGKTYYDPQAVCNAKYKGQYDTHASHSIDVKSLVKHQVDPTCINHDLNLRSNNAATNLSLHKSIDARFEKYIDGNETGDLAGNNKFTKQEMTSFLQRKINVGKACGSSGRSPYDDKPVLMEEHKKLSKALGMDTRTFNGRYSKEGAARRMKDLDAKAASAASARNEKQKAGKAEAAQRPWQEQEQYQQQLREEHDQQARYNLRGAYQAQHYQQHVAQVMHNPAYTHIGQQEVRGWGGYQGGPREMFRSPQGKEFYITPGYNRVYVSGGGPPLAAFGGNSFGSGGGGGIGAGFLNFDYLF